MPWFAWVLVSIATTALMGPPALWSPAVKANPSPKRYDASRVEYRTWASSPRVDKRTGECTFTLFALVTREKLTRLQINGNEMLLDWSWSWETKMPAGVVGTGMVVRFLDPVGGKVVAEHEVSASCPWLNQEVWK